MNTENNKNFDELITGAIGRDKLQFDFNKWQKNHKKEIEIYNTQKTEQKEHPVRIYKIGRIIMKSKLSKITIAAVVFLAIILGFKYLGAPIDGASKAFAAAMDSIKNAATFSCIVITEELYDDNGELKKFQYKRKVMFKEPDLERREQLASPWPEEEGKTTIIDFSKRQALTITPAEKTAELYDISDGDELSTSIRDWLLEKSSGSFDDLGDVELNGQYVRMIQSKENNWVYTIWIDPKTGYPVQIEMKLPEQNFTPISYTSIQIDTELDDKLFSQEPPEDYDLKFKETANTIEYQNKSFDNSSSEDSGKQKAFLNITDILDLWEAGYGSIYSMKVRYTEDITLPDPNGKETILHTTVERIQDGRKFYCQQISSNPAFPRSESNREGAFDGNVSTFCDHKSMQGNIEHGIAARGFENINSLEDYMWIKRFYINSDYPDGQTYFAFWVRAYIFQGSTNNKYSVHVLPKLETIMGEQCHVVELVSTNGNGEKQKFWVAQNKGLLVMKYERYKNRVVVDKVEVLKIAKIITDIGEVWYPTEVKKVTVDTVVKLGRVQTSQFQVQEFVPNITNIPPETFNVKFPVGTRVFDKVRGITNTQTE